MLYPLHTWQTKGGRRLRIHALILYLYRRSLNRIETLLPMAVKKIVSWNVNGIRAIVKKGFMNSVRALAPDVLCLQETKATEDEVKTALLPLEGYTVYANSSKARKGYSGVAVLCRQDPVWVTCDMGVARHDREGRIIVAEFMDFFLLNVYTPNSGSALARLDYREDWDRAFLDYVKWLTRRKPIVICGDLNVAHQEIDIARAKENYNKSAGYTQREIDGFQRLIDEGQLIDTFRHRHPEKVAYTYWNYFTKGRDRNVGWRIDYFLASQRQLPKTREPRIHDDHYGSDHCPVSLEIEY